MPPTLKCRSCGLDKVLEEFAPSHRQQGSGICRSCNTERAREYRAKQDNHRSKLLLGSISCSVCKIEKTAAEFRWNSRTGYKTECKQCETVWLRCANCRKIKRHDEFPPSKASSVGRHSWCLDCHTARQLEKYRADPEFREECKEYYRTERAKQWRRRYRERPGYKEKARAQQREYTKIRWHEKPIERLKQKARVSVGHAVRVGKITKATTCEANGKYGNVCTGTGANGRLEGHHLYGYWPKAVWLMVEWLCPGCHEVADKVQREADGLVLDDRNPALVAVQAKMQLAKDWMGIDRRGLFNLAMDCTGQDEMEAILNFLDWLKTNGFKISKET